MLIREERLWRIDLGAKRQADSKPELLRSCLMMRCCPMETLGAGGGAGGAVGEAGSKSMGFEGEEPSTMT